jgi:diaminohydroxyphosphoribosylaminopyrimidine deaminase / 5-amino-6-(5-phosphoribosylamino)uracil reductase
VCSREETGVDVDERDLMLEAIRLASAEHPHPNPRVGAIVLDTHGAVVGSGSHVAPGSPHAETLALDEAGEHARGGTLITTLEPCPHRGRTEPCAEGVVAAGISRVVVGREDPDGRVSGRGIAFLRAAGIEVEHGVAAAEVEALDPGYFHHRRTGRPLVTLKMASTLDGQVAASDGSSQWITSEEARADAHRLRARSDAIMVGAGTVLSDDPRLTARVDGVESAGPVPVVIAGTRPLPPAAAVFHRPCLVYSTAEVDLPNTENVVLAGHDGVHLESVIADLGKRDIVDLLVEGGPRIAGSLLRSGLVDRVVWYLGARLAAGVGLSAVAGPFASMSDLMVIDIESVDRVGQDIRIDARVRRA